MAQANEKTSPATESAHTKGPWTYSACKNVWEHDAFCISSEDTDCIAITPGWDRRYFATQEEANARLIAAAPELLEACEALIDGWRGNLTEAARKCSVAVARAKDKAA